MSDNPSMAHAAALQATAAGTAQHLARLMAASGQEIDQVGQVDPMLAAQIAQQQAQLDFAKWQQAQPSGTDLSGEKAQWKDPTVGGSHSERVERFIAYWSIDGDAADLLREADPTAASLAMDKGVADARKRSGALKARLRDALKELDNRGCGDPVVEAFVKSSGIGPWATEALYKCEPAVRQLVMDKGVRSARNPCTALMARIKEAKAQVARTRQAESMDMHLKT